MRDDPLVVLLLADLPPTGAWLPLAAAQFWLREHGQDDAPATLSALVGRAVRAGYRVTMPRGRFVRWIATTVEVDAIAAQYAERWG